MLKKPKLRIMNNFRIIIFSTLQLKDKNIIINNFMLHIYILRFSSFIHANFNLYRFGQIALTFKTNNCKTPLPEPFSSYSFRKNCSINSTTNL